MTETRLHGRAASPGHTSGRVFVLATSEAPRRAASSDPAIEAAALRDAVAAALAETHELEARSDGETADMIAFQAAMLEDEELFRPAVAAWAEAMDA
jgi:phosphotransferase system enzyme I (PtsI)